MSDNTTLATDSAESCPGCGFRDSSNTPFAICPRCGLVIRKYRLRQQPPAVPGEEPVDAQISVPDCGPAEAVNKPGTLIGTVLRCELYWPAIGFLLLLAVTFLAVKFVVPLMGHDHKKAAQEQELKLFQAVGRGDQEMVRRLLLTGVNPNAVHQNQTLMEIALKMSEVEIAEILVAKGASLSIRGGNVNSLFLQEINRNNTKSALFLLSHGADANAAFYGDHSVLCSAAAHGNMELVLALLGHGANVNFVGERGNTPLISAAYNQQLEVMKLLLERGVNASPRNSYGYTPLRIAREKRNGEMVTLLTNAGTTE